MIQCKIRGDIIHTLELLHWYAVLASVIQKKVVCIGTLHLKKEPQSLKYK